jgi:protein-S-isoprenylcysteine O-methyltransferase Ste14
MRDRFVYAALLLVICGAVYLVTAAMNLLNQPSDWKVAGGVGLLIAVIVLFPAAMRWIWHHKTTPHRLLNR